MKINFDITIDEFKKQLSTIKKEGKIAIWGAGRCATDFIRMLDGCNEFVAYYVDKSETKWNTKIGNVEVKSPADLFSDDSVNTIIIATMYFSNGVEELEEKGFSGSVYSAFHMVYREEQRNYRPLEEHIEDVKKMLADNKSRDIVDYICQHRKSMDIDFSDIYEENQYFIKDIVRVNPNAFFVDAGAYHGETIDQFIDFQGRRFNRVYSFEMDEKNYKKIKEKNYDERVKLLNYGLWDERTTCTYSSDDTCSSIGEEGDLTAQCITLDEVIGDGNVTFIKMDIEGAELKALYGAEKCIKRCKPQLAICVYHKPEDIYEISNLIHKWLPEHQLYIRHHSVTFTETVLYAVPQ